MRPMIFKHSNITGVVLHIVDVDTIKEQFEYNTTTSDELLRFCVWSLGQLNLWTIVH